MNKFILVFSLCLGLYSFAFFGHLSSCGHDLINIRDDHDRTSLHQAVIAGDESSVKDILAECQGDALVVNALDFNRKTAFDYAQQYHKNNPRLQMSLMFMLKKNGGRSGYDVEEYSCI